MTHELKLVLCKASEEQLQAHCEVVFVRWQLTGLHLLQALMQVVLDWQHQWYILA